jgi:hypothetical protein
MDQLIQIYSDSPLWSWLLGSVLAYGLATNTLWILRSRDRLPVPYASWLVQIARFLFYLGIPYLALGGWPRPPFGGLLSLADMGLVGLGGRWPPSRWLEAAATAIGFGLLACLLLGLAWANANRSRSTGAGPSRRPFPFPARPWWAILIDVLYSQVHWAFYWGALAVLLQDLYRGVFLGLGLVYLEWALNPFWRRGWRGDPQAAAQWLGAALALVTALIFLSTRNLWLCLGVHAVLELLFWGFGREPRAASQQETTEALPPLVSNSDLQD